MIQQYKKYSLISGSFLQSYQHHFALRLLGFFTDDIFERMKEYLFDCGIDVMGSFVCGIIL